MKCILLSVAFFIYKSALHELKMSYTVVYLLQIFLLHKICMCKVKLCIKYVNLSYQAKIKYLNYFSCFYEMKAIKFSGSSFLSIYLFTNLF